MMTGDLTDVNEGFLTGSRMTLVSTLALAILAVAVGLVSYARKG